MNADWDDAPSRIRRKAGTAAVWGVSLAFGLCITGGGLYLASGQMTTSAATHAQLSRFSADALRKPEAVHASQPANQQPYESPRIDEKNWIRPSDDAHRDAQAELQEWSRARAQEQHDRQTSFSDANYVPQGARNLVPSTRVASELVTPRQKRQEVVIVGKADPRLSDYCPYAKGSIEHRNCKARINLNTRNR